MTKKIQQRELLIREYEDEIEFDGIAWKVKVPKEEAVEFFSSWLNGLLKENSHFKNEIPKILEE